MENPDCSCKLNTCSDRRPAAAEQAALERGGGEQGLAVGGLRGRRGRCLLPQPVRPPSALPALFRRLESSTPTQVLLLVLLVLVLLLILLVLVLLLALLVLLVLLLALALVLVLDLLLSILLVLVLVLLLLDRLLFCSLI